MSPNLPLYPTPALYPCQTGQTWVEQQLPSADLQLFCWFLDLLPGMQNYFLLLFDEKLKEFCKGEDVSVDFQIKKFCYTLIALCTNTFYVCMKLLKLSQLCFRAITSIFCYQDSYLEGNYILTFQMSVEIVFVCPPPPLTTYLKCLSKSIQSQLGLLIRGGG